MNQSTRTWQPSSIRAFLALLMAICAGGLCGSGLAGPVLLPPSAVAADSLEGNYALTRVDGSPIQEGVEVTMSIVPSYFPCYFGVVIVHTEEGPFVADIMTICPGNGHFVTKNSDGNTGTITPKGEGQFETEMTSGPNKGVKRKITKQS